MSGQGDTEPLNTTKEQPAKLQGGITGKGWRQGQSGNPGGRPRGLARMVRDRVLEGEKLAALYYRLAFGGTFKMRVLVSQEDGSVAEKDLTIRPKLQDRLTAAQWLSDRGFGKVKDVVKLEGDELKLPIAMVTMHPLVDPLAEDAVFVEKPLPALPSPQAEVGFEADTDFSKDEP